MLKQEDIIYLVVHCSDTDDNSNIGASEIHNLHLKFGWDGIGYHKVIKRNGNVQEGRPEYWIGAHVFGYNKNSLGVCLIGRNKFTKKQIHSLKNVLLNWKKKYPKAKILGHRDFPNTTKTCPNFDVKTLLTNEKYAEKI